MRSCGEKIRVYYRGKNIYHEGATLLRNNAPSIEYSRFWVWRDRKSELSAFECGVSYLGLRDERHCAPWHGEKDMLTEL